MTESHPAHTVTTTNKKIKKKIIKNKHNQNLPLKEAIVQSSRETGISSKAQTPERQREEGKEQQTGTSQITPTLPWVPTEYQPENFPRPGVGLGVEIDFTSWAALRALTIVASPKWLWIPAQLLEHSLDSGSSPGDGAPS